MVKAGLTCIRILDLFVSPKLVFMEFVQNFANVGFFYIKF